MLREMYFVMWAGLVLCAGYTVRGVANWKSGGDDDVNVGLMGAIAPAYYLLAGRLPESVLVAMVVTAVVVTIAWRVQLIRKARARAQTKAPE
jgi:hypothetical protein